MYMYIFNQVLCLLGLVLLFEKLSFVTEKVLSKGGVQEEQTLSFPLFTFCFFTESYLMTMSYMQI